MKPKVISLFPLQRFVEAGFSLPDRLEFHFENALEEGAVISACEEMDFLVVPPAYPLISARVVENILRVAAGEPPRNVVNGVPDVRTP
jgi:hypothetical protein